MCTDGTPTMKHQGGFTLIELVVFIIIVSVSIAGVLSVLNTTVMHSADPLVSKQLIAAAESLMEEVTLQPLTYCDPDDANVLSADNAAGCAGGVAAETRYADPRFDNVADYNGFAMAGIRDVNNGAIAALANYNANVAVADATAAFNAANATAYGAGTVLSVAVTVTRGGEAVTLTSYRFRYAPNSP